MKIVKGTKTGKRIIFEENKKIYIVEANTMIIYEKHDIGKDLKKIRKKAKLTQLELADKINLSKVSIIKIEKGEVSPKVSTVCSWLRTCGYELIIRHHHTEETDIDIHCAD